MNLRALPVPFWVVCDSGRFRGPNPIRAIGIESGNPIIEVRFGGTPRDRLFPVTLDASDGWREVEAPKESADA